MNSIFEIKEGNRSIVFAGGCFWGVDHFFKKIKGVDKTAAVYVNGNIENPTYEDICRGNTNFAEGVFLEYNPEFITLNTLLHYFFKIIDPTLLNQQGNDIGTQYRTGVYYKDEEDRQKTLEFLKAMSNQYKQPIVTEVKPLENIYLAEEYHQDYLDKNPNGYCHISFGDLPRYDEQLVDIYSEEYKVKDQAVLKQELDPISYAVTQESQTEAPFSSAYDQNFNPGIYVDKTTGQPLFTAQDKFDAGCGWPSFTKPIAGALIQEIADHSYGMNRVEVRSLRGDAHLGHVFSDGPKEKGGLRYCINGAALRFIPKDEMKAQGYGYLLPLLL